MGNFYLCLFFFFFLERGPNFLKGTCNVCEFVYNIYKRAWTHTHTSSRNRSLPVEPQCHVTRVCHRHERATFTNAVSQQTPVQDLFLSYSSLWLQTPCFHLLKTFPILSSLVTHGACRAHADSRSAGSPDLQARPCQWITRVSFHGIPYCL